MFSCEHKQPPRAQRATMVSHLMQGGRARVVGVIAYRNTRTHMLGHLKPLARGTRTHPQITM